MKNKIGHVLLIIIIVEFFLSSFFGLIAGENRQLLGILVYTFIISAYAVIIIMLLIEGHPVESFSLDSMSLLIIVVSCFIREKFYVGGEIFYLVILALLGLSILVIAIKKRLFVYKFDLKNIFPIFLWTLITLFVVSMVEIVEVKMLPEVTGVPPQFNISLALQQAFRETVFQVSWVTVAEEVFFRGFMPGYLIKLGLKEKNAFIIQAVVFWLMHFRNINTPITFFISIPLLTISMTMIVWRYKKVSAAILIHTLANVANSLILYYLL